MCPKRRKIIASMLIFMITITHLNVIGEVFATNLESQNIQTNLENVELEESSTKIEEQAELNMQISKYIPYDINGNKGVVLQSLLQSYLKDNTLPVKENKIEILVPTINGIKPDQVKVIANTTKATNGDESGEKFSQENYIYDSENTKLTITVKNKEKESDEVSWKKDAKDEFVVTYIYPETAIVAEEKIVMRANSELTVYGEEERKLSKTFEEEVTLKEQISNLVDFSINTNVESISKGQIYANYQAENKLETEYQETITTNITMASLTDKILLEQNIDNFITKENAKLEATQTYYKQIIVNQKEFDKIIGAEGEIALYSGTTPIAKINKDTQANEKGELIVDLSTLNINSLNIETSKPQTEGKYTIRTIKAIKGEVGYVKTEIANINKLEVNVTGKAINGTTNFVEQSQTKEVTFTEPTSQAELLIDNTKLSTVVTNENVKITAKLKTDTLDCNLYINPTLKITMPSYVENINVKNVEVLFDTEGSKLTLKPNDNRVIQNADGTKTILIELEGTQTEYTLGAVSKGINVVITTDITVNKFTPNKQDQIKMIYTNQNVITKARTVIEETNETATQINIVAPVGVITTSTISNYKENAENVTSISGEEKVAVIPTLVEEKIANLSMEVINNYNNTIDNITILGRTMFKGNKDILTEKDLGTTVNMPLTSNITLNGVDANKVAIYYSENGEATKDLSLASNGWTLTPVSLENVKSYLIVLTDYSMNTGDKINFNYSIQIPENLQHNEAAYENYVVYFNNNLQTGIIEDKQASTKIGVTTGSGPELDVKMTSNIEETVEILTGKFIKYNINVKNTGEEIVENVVAIVKLPDNIRYIEFFEGENGQYIEINEKEIKYQLENIKPNEEISKSFWVIVKTISIEDFCSDDTHYIEINGSKCHKTDIKHSLEEYKTEISLSTLVTATKLEKEIKSNEVKNNIKKSYFSSSVSTTTNGTENLKKGDKLEYNISVWAMHEDVGNTVLKTIIPEGLEYETTEIKRFNQETLENETTNDQVNYNKKNRELTINLGTATTQDNRTISIISKVGELEKEEFSRKITSVATIIANGIEEKTNEIIDTIVKSAIKVSQTSTIPEENKISAGEKFSYKLLIENIGVDEIGNLEIESQLPQELQYIDTEYTVSGELKLTSNIDENNITRLILNIPKGENVEVKINVTAREITEEKEISNVISVSSDSISTLKTNVIKHIIEPVDYKNKEDITTIKRKITGQVWMDTNNNGIKEDEESKASNIEVMLFNNITGKLVTDTNGNILKQITSEDGSYKFSDISQGKYTVIFIYDTANYSATTYRKQNTDDAINSDAIDTQITIDGVKIAAAITEEINVDTNIYNIDLGLVSNPKFDLKLDKSVSKITVQDEKETKVYELNDSKLAKKELVEKYIDSTTIIVEYKIKVTNEGAISGFVKKIADYIPSEMKFNSELNKDWYIAENGVLYNSSLSNTLINPGESKEVTLTLTKKMTKENLGLYHNEAEIFEAYNDLGIKDTDSIEGNKETKEDDISSADVLITVKTGKELLFIGLSLSIIITIGISTYFIKKKVLR